MEEDYAATGRSRGAALEEEVREKLKDLEQNLSAGHSRVLQLLEDFFRPVNGVVLIHDESDPESNANKVAFPSESAALGAKPIGPESPVISEVLPPGIQKLDKDVKPPTSQPPTLACAAIVPLPTEPPPPLDPQHELDNRRSMLDAATVSLPLMSLPLPGVAGNSPRSSVGSHSGGHGNSHRDSTMSELNFDPAMSSEKNRVATSTFRLEGSTFRISTSLPATEKKKGKRAADSLLAANARNGRRPSRQIVQQLHNDRVRIKDDVKLYDMLAVWNQPERKTNVPGARLFERQSIERDSINFNATGDTTDEALEEDADQTQTPHHPWYIIHPNSMYRSFWDIGGMLLVLYDMIFIPMEAFDIPESTFFVFMVWLTRLFWTVDIGMSFMTGYLMKDGFIELRPIKIAHRYARSWLVLDFIIVLADWVQLMIESAMGIGYARIGKSARAFRIMRIVRLLRVFRILEALRGLTERLLSETLVILADMAKIVLTMVGLSHILACLWYTVSDEQSSSEKTWVQEFGYEQAQISMTYATSLHWSLLQFAGGTDEIFPMNLTERIFAVVTFVFGFIMASMFVSRLTSSMTRLHMIAGKQSQQIASLRRFLRVNGVSNKLSLRVQRNAVFTISERQRFIPESHVDLLEAVSKPLRVELHFEMHSPVLAHHPFFFAYIRERPYIMRSICHEAVMVMSFATGDVLFDVGETRDDAKMYIATEGAFDYTRVDGVTVEVSPVTWVSEASLWICWMHHGTLSARANSRVLVLEAKAFSTIVSQFHHPFFDPRKYAVEFAHGVNGLDDDLSDLPCGEEQKWLEKSCRTVKIKHASNVFRNSKNGLGKIFPSKTININLVGSRKVDDMTNLSEVCPP